MFQSHASLASWAVAVASATMIGGYICIQLQNPSPGELSAAHSQVTALAGGTNCVACHGAPGTKMTDACLTCHQAIAAQISNSQGLHGRIPAQLRDQCATCHAEHHGSEFPPTNAKSFELAGISNVAQFDHANLDFHLKGIHATLSCTQCHANAAQPILATGKRRFLGLTQDCQACHTDVHQGQFGANCESCHGQTQAFDQAAKFQHTDDFTLAGAHANLRCQACHVSGSANSVYELLNRRATGLAPTKLRTCNDCHQSPHSPILISVVAAQLGLDRATTCEACHSAQHASFQVPQASVTPEIHSLVGFPLTPPHNDLSCQKCHPGFGEPKQSLATFVDPPRAADDCRVCHGDPHLGQFDASATAQRANCLACHSREHFVPALFDAAHHAQTNFPLRGAHMTLDCSRCHGQQSIVISPTNRGVAATRTVRTFRGTSSSCAACHRDPHAGQFAHGVFAKADCKACHNEHDFTKPIFTTEQHHATNFPLTGAHRAVGCNDCHKEFDVTNLDGRPAEQARSSRTRKFHGTPTRCDACHVDVHQGAFVKSERVDQGNPALDCAHCHSTESFSDTEPQGFDHGQWTGFALRGTHAQTKCSACHAPDPKPDANGRTFGKAAGRNCQDCHRDSHAGQFGNTADVQCAACHVDGNSFRELVFDHQRDARFQLDELHGKLECAACHRPYRLTNGQIVTRYKPLGTECADCHLPQPNSNRSERQ